MANKQLGSAVSDSKTLTYFETSLQLSRNDTFEVFGTRKDNELVRIDYVAIDWLLTA